MVLKVAWPDERTAWQLVGLRAWEGRGMVTLVDAGSVGEVQFCSALTRTIGSLTFRGSSPLVAWER